MEYRNSWPSLCLAEYGGRRPPGPTTQRGVRYRVGLDLLESRHKSLKALAPSDAKSRTPMTGFVTVPTIPFPKPVTKPYEERTIKKV